MEKFTHQATEFTPDILLDPKAGIISINGKSFWENTTHLYAPVLKWMDEYMASPAPKTVANIRLDYFNTATAKALMDIFRRLEKFAKTNDVEVNWLFHEDDEDLEEAGEEYARMLDLTFNLKSFRDE
jgi:hypothetical protein